MDNKEFISTWINRLTAEGTKEFPAEFLFDVKVKEIELPGKTLVIGNEFFGVLEILTVDGSSIMQAENIYTAKYIIYSNRNKPLRIKIPEDEKDIKNAVTSYSNYLDSLIKKIEKDYKDHFANIKDFNSTTNEIFRILNLTRY